MDEQSILISGPKSSNWSCYMADIIWTPAEGKEPNWFHRLMQELILGFKWRKNGHNS